LFLRRWPGGGVSIRPLPGQTGGIRHLGRLRSRSLKCVVRYRLVDKVRKRLDESRQCDQMLGSATRRIRTRAYIARAPRCSHA
jgi:hypothetical protein